MSCWGSHIFLPRHYIIIYLPFIRYALCSVFQFHFSLDVLKEELSFFRTFLSKLISASFLILVYSLQGRLYCLYDKVLLNLLNLYHNISLFSFTFCCSSIIFVKQLFPSYSSVEYGCVYFVRIISVCHKIDSVVYQPPTSLLKFITLKNTLSLRWSCFLKFSSCL